MVSNWGCSCSFIANLQSLTSRVNAAIKPWQLQEPLPCSLIVGNCKQLRGQYGHNCGGRHSKNLDIATANGGLFFKTLLTPKTKRQRNSQSYQDNSSWLHSSHLAPNPSARSTQATASSTCATPPPPSSTALSPYLSRPNNKNQKIQKSQPAKQQHQ